MPRVRFTVRGLMLAVALAAFACAGLAWAAAMRARSDRYRVRMRYYASREAGERKSLAVLVPALRAAIGKPPRPTADGCGMVVPVDRGLYDRSIARYSERADWYGAMTAKYRRAARYPWLSVAPDPPEPK